MSIPLRGHLVALEVWRMGLANVALYAAVRLPAGTFEMHTSQSLLSALAFLNAVRDFAGSAYGTEIDFEGLTRCRETFINETALRRFMGRTIRHDLGDDDGWHPAFDDPDLNLNGKGELSALPIDRYGPESVFRRGPELPTAKAAAVITGDNGGRFDPDAVAARLAARRAAKRAASAAAGDLKPTTGGSIRVKAFHAESRSLVADLPVIGLSSDGAAIPGRIVSNNHAFAVIEADADTLSRAEGPVTWVLGTNPNGVAVGTTPADASE